MQLSQDYLSLIRASLPHKSINRIAQKTGKSRQAVYDVLKGKYENEEIIKEAQVIIEEQNQIKLHLTKALKG